VVDAFVVRAAVQQRGWEVLGIEDGFDGLLDQNKIRPLGLAEVRGILPRGGTILGTSNRGNPFSYPVAGENGVEYRDVSGQVVERLESLGVDGLVVIGGDGSLKIALELMNRGVRVVGVPKTIDNDLMETDVTFGYNTALETATYALDKLHSTAESHHRVMIMEVMGRYAGWIALESGISGGADVILIPEIPFDMGRVCQAIDNRRLHGSRFSVVVAAEGAFPKGGRRVVQQPAGGPHALERLGGIGEYVARELSRCSSMDARVMVLGHLQRGGSPSSFDRILGSRLGVKAVELVESGRFGEMAALRGGVIDSVPMERAVRALKVVEPAGELVRCAESLGIMLGR
jgi:6-phosphofructokinase 1